MLLAATFFVESAYAAKFVSKSRSKPATEEVEEKPETESIESTPESDIRFQTDPALEEFPEPTPSKVFKSRGTSEDRSSRQQVVEEVEPVRERRRRTIREEKETLSASEDRSFRQFDDQFMTSGGRLDVGSTKLTLVEAERIALSIDPMVASAKSQKTAFKERAVAAYSWPDPKLQLGMMNLPVDSFDFEKEPMTQATFGIVQPIPPSGSVTAKRDRFNELAAAADSGVKGQMLKTLLSVRKSWLNTYFQHQTRQLVNESLKMFEQLIKITQFQYRAGRGKQQDVVRAQLEQSLLMDRQKGVEQKLGLARAALGKWIGEDEINRELDYSFPELPELPSMGLLESKIEDHPALKEKKSRVKASENKVKLAEAQFNSGWMLGLKYGYRGGNRSDFLSATVSMDLPFFTGSRQDPQLRASKSDLSSMKDMVKETRRVLRKKLDDGMASYRWIGERLELYRSTLLPQAEQNTQATMNAYQSDVTSFNDVVRAGLTELNSRIKFLKLRIDQAKVQADLLYLAGGK